MKINSFKIEEWMNRYERFAKYDMTATCISSFSLKEFFEFVNADFSEIMEKPLHYGDITGSERLKKAASALYKNKTTDNVCVTLGAIGANHLVFISLLEENDKVVSVIPTYQQHYSVPEQLGCDVHPVKLKKNLNWHIDLDELNDCVTLDTKMITLNNPNNPTGSVLSDDELYAIIEIARKNDAYVLCDEVYRFLNHDKNSSVLSVADIYEKGISTFSMSKTFSLAGIRIGFIVADKNLVSEFNHQRQYNTISVSAIDDYIAALALENKDKIIDRNRKIILSGKKALTEWIKTENKFTLTEPQAGTTVLIEYDDKRNSYDFCLDLFDDTGVLLLPGDAMEMEKCFRLGYCGEINNFKKGLSLISEWAK